LPRNNTNKKSRLKERVFLLVRSAGAGYFTEVTPARTETRRSSFSLRWISVKIPTFLVGGWVVRGVWEGRGIFASDGAFGEVRFSYAVFPTNLSPHLPSLDEVSLYMLRELNISGRPPLLYMS
jgi:hypothetical protein